MRRPLFAVAVAMGLVAATALPASAGDSTVTFSITTAGITISEPGSVNLGSVAAGTASVEGQIGPVTVTDLRGTLGGSWNATVVGGDFTTGGGTPAETIPVSNETYYPGSATSTTGSGTFTPGVGGIINVPRSAFTGTELTGNNAATWNPTFELTIPSAAVAGTYTGTVSQSVA